MRGKAGAIGANRKKTWNISYRNAYSAFLDVSSQTMEASGIALGDNGTKLYMSGGSFNDSPSVYQYDMATAWSLSGASYANKSVNVSSQVEAAQGIEFSPNGAEMFVCGGDAIAEYSLSAAWDVSTATYGASFSVSLEHQAIQSVRFSPDGQAMFIASNISDSIVQYSLSSPWSISTAAFVQAFSISGQVSQPAGLSFRSNGKTVLTAGITNNNIFEYELTTPWDISSASLAGTHAYFTNNPAAAINSVSVDSAGTRLYLLADLRSSLGAAPRIYQYNIE